MSDLVGNPEDRFSHNKAHLISRQSGKQCRRVARFKVIKLFSCSTQLSMKFKPLINIEIAEIYEIFRFKSPKPVVYKKSCY